MIKRHCRQWPSFWRKNCNFFLACSWMSGLLAGQFLLLRADTSVYGLLRSAVSQPTSIAGLFVTAVIPFVLYSIAVFFSRPWLLVLLCFTRSLIFSYIVLGIAVSFWTSSWLIRWIFLFSQCTSVSLEYWYWRHCLSGEHGFDVIVFILLISIVFLIVSLDYGIVLPFGARLLDYTKG